MNKMNNINRKIIIYYMCIFIYGILLSTACIKTALNTSNEVADKLEKDVSNEEMKWSWYSYEGKQKKIDIVKKEITEIIKSCNINGISIEIKQAKIGERNPTSCLINIGFMDSNSKRMIDGLTVFQANRLGHPIIAFIALRLHYNKLINIKIPIYNIIDISDINKSRFADLANDDRYKSLTMKMILSHQSGIINSRFDRQDKKLLFLDTPGKKFRYSDEAYSLLRYILEQKLGKSINEIAEEYVFKPLGIRRTSFIIDKRFEGYTVKEPTSKDEAFITNASDYMRFIWDSKFNNIYMSHDDLLSYMYYPSIATESNMSIDSSPLSEMASPKTKTFWCLGWGVYKLPRVYDGICNFIGQSKQNIQSYSVIYFSSKSTAVTIFIVGENKSQAMELIIEAVLGKIDNPLKWLGFK